MLANPCQSWTIRCQSLANPWPVTFLTIEQVVYVGWPLVYSEDEFEATSIDNHNQFRPTMTSSRRSMPILANAMPIQGQSDVNLSPQPIIHICQSSCQFLTIHANLGQPDVNPWPIPYQSRANHIPIWGQSDANPGTFLGPIQNHLIHFFANSSQSNTNPVPIWCQSKVNFSMNLCQSLPIHANPSQSNANFRPIRDQLRY